MWFRARALQRQVISSISTIYRSTCSTSVRAPQKERNGNRCPLRKCVSATSSAYWKRAKATACERHRPWVLGAPAYIGTSEAIGRSRTLTESPEVLSLDNRPQTQAGRVLIPSAGSAETHWRVLPEGRTCAFDVTLRACGCQQFRSSVIGALCKPARS